VAKPAPAPVAPVVPAAGDDAAQVEAAIAAIWQRTLGVAASGRDNFFDLGGHSLLAVQAHRAIREELGAAKLSITDIFRFPVLADLAARVAGLADGAVRAPAAPVAPKPEPAPVVAAPGRAQSRSEAIARRREMRARRRA